MKIQDSEFYKNITKTDSGIVDKRAEIAAKQLSGAYMAFLTEKDNEIDATSLKILDLQDFGPDESTSLRPVTFKTDVNVIVKEHVSALLRIAELKLKRAAGYDAYCETFGKAFVGNYRKL